MIPTVKNYGAVVPIAQRERERER
eukprot:COSAG03_NODE_21559_length_302_cov_1.876847_2_plen_23_part_01